MLATHWGRQIGIDLYLGVGLAMLLIGLHGGALTALLWLVPTIIFVNLSVLLYFAIHLDEIALRLVGA